MDYMIAGLILFEMCIFYDVFKRPWWSISESKMLLNSKYEMPDSVEIFESDEVDEFNLFDMILIGVASIFIVFHLTYLFSDFNFKFTTLSQEHHYMI